METKGFVQFKIIINVFALSDSFENLCYGSTAIINMLIFTVQGSTLVAPQIAAASSFTCTLLHDILNQNGGSLSKQSAMLCRHQALSGCFSSQFSPNSN